MKNQEVIQKINFSEIKEKFTYLNSKSLWRESNRSVQINQKTEKINENKIGQQDNNSDQQKSMEKVQELIDKIKDTAITVRFFMDNGLMRAHVINRVNEALLVTIPGYLNVEGSTKEMFFKMNEQMLVDLLGSNTGSNVDTQV